MLEAINFKIFGAFSGILGILLWLVYYFKAQYEKERDRNRELIKERHAEQEKQLEVLKATQSILKRNESE